MNCANSHLTVQGSVKESNVKRGEACVICLQPSEFGNIKKFHPPPAHRGAAVPLLPWLSVLVPSFLYCIAFE